MRKTLIILLCLLPALCLCAGCGGAPDSVNNEKPQVVATIFPAYDWLREIAGDKIELTLLVKGGADMHSFQPTVDDMVKIASCDMFVYVGGESDKWVDDALREAVNKDMTAVSLLELLGDAAREEEIREGMQAEKEAETAYDEHVWLSLPNAALFCRSLCDSLCALDADNAAFYTANAEAYTEKLNELDALYRQAVAQAKTRTLLFADRFPFRYLVEDYGLDYYAAFPGCSAETEASFATVIFLAGKLDELGLGSVIQLENSQASIARTVRENSKSKDQRILTMDSLQSLTASEIENGAGYLEAMRENLEVLKEALN